MPGTTESSPTELKHIIEALLLSSGSPLTLEQLVSLFEGQEGYSRDDIGVSST